MAEEDTPQIEENPETGTRNWDDPVKTK